MISSEPALPCVSFAAIPLQATPDQMRATQHGVGSLSRRAFSFQSSRLFPSFLRAGAGSGDCLGDTETLPTSVAVFIQ